MAILSPVILLIALLCSLGSGASSHNNAVVNLCFNGGMLPPDMPPEYAAYIEEMRSSFAQLDGFISAINGMTEGENCLDGTRVKAIFCALYFGADDSIPRIPHPFALRLAPTHLGWGTRRQFTRRSRDPPGSKRRQNVTFVMDPCVSRVLTRTLFAR